MNNDVVSSSLTRNFFVLNHSLNLIKRPLNVNNFSTDEILYTNNLDLNIANYKKYYPTILESLENDESCSDDLYYDFYEINSMSMYIYNIIEENMNENMYLGTNLNLNYLNKLLLFIEELLNYFHQILDKKILLINNIIDKTDFDKEYQEYSLNLSKQRSYYLEHIKKTKNNGLSEDIKELWSMKLE